MSDPPATLRISVLSLPTPVLKFSVPRRGTGIPGNASAWTVLNPLDFVLCRLLFVLYFLVLVL